jgi:hypothetical protein
VTATRDYTDAVWPRLKRSVTLGAAALIVACGGSPTAPVPADEGIIIYRDINFRSDSEPLNRDVENLERLDGPCDKTSNDDVVIETWGDCISSVRVNPGRTATLYEHDNFRGRSFTITEGSPNLTTVPGPCRNSFNDCISSIRVSTRL